ncbi:MAG: mechanosensitive ion channel [Pseudomonadota bacterium]
MQQYINKALELVGAYVPNLVGAIAILILGWLVALAFSSILTRILRRTKLSQRIAQLISKEDEEKEVPVELYISKAFYYLILIFVLVAFFQTLGLTIVTDPLNQLLTQIFAYAPQIIGAILLLILAWALATILRLIVSKLLTTLKIDERLGEKTGVEEKEKTLPLTKTISNAVYWLVFLFFLLAILGSLQLQGLLDPIKSMTDKMLAYLPNIFSAGLILLIGWILATIIKRIVVNLLSAIGTDRLIERVGLTTVLGKQKLSDILGLIVYILILIPILISALQALELESITQPATNMLNSILLALPAIFAATMIIVVSYVVGKLIAKLVTDLLTGLGFNGIMVKLGLAKEETKEQKTPSEFVGYLVLIGILFFASIEALRLLNFENVANLISQFTVFAGKILLGLIIMGIGLFIANLVSDRIKAGKSSQSSVYALFARIAILVLVGAMALQEMGFANDIIITAFGLGMGALAIAAAIAFGIGGKDIAARELEKWVDSMKSDKS